MTPITPTAPVYCPLWRRLIALVYDLLAVVAIVMVVGYICQRATGGTLITSDGHAHIAWWYQPLQALVVSAYFVASWMRGGQTLGMRPWHIRVTAANGSPLMFGQALIRLAAAALPLLLLGLAPWIGTRGALWAVAIAWSVWFGVAAFDARRRTVHDVMARTVLQIRTSR
ncbi:RDD family protein [Dyella jiangningensis]|uniref:RDD family protein n=1 Tax=Dyella jiangningensis TaxID=1379159 RepID=UPI00240EA935|nr:RDD family protein [Dyella jiangningensis]MDG2539449.1 RDD family protein [Dyella jiangningensis]